MPEHVTSLNQFIRELETVVKMIHDTLRKPRESLEQWKIWSIFILVKFSLIEKSANLVFRMAWERDKKEITFYSEQK